jgi:hypothetical protein
MRDDNVIMSTCHYKIGDVVLFRGRIYSIIYASRNGFGVIFTRLIDSSGAVLYWTIVSVEDDLKVIEI